MAKLSRIRFKFTCSALLFFRQEFVADSYVEMSSAQLERETLEVIEGIVNGDYGKFVKDFRVEYIEVEKIHDHVEFASAEDLAKINGEYFSEMQRLINAVCEPYPSDEPVVRRHHAERRTVPLWAKAAGGFAAGYIIGKNID